MFTFRAEQHRRADDTAPDYQSWQAESYAVRVKDNGGREVELSGGAFPIVGDNSLFIYVGDKEPYATMYVTNAAGKTVDTIR